MLRPIKAKPLRVAAKDAASPDRPCARRPRDLAVGRKNARGAGQTKEWTNRLRRLQN